MPELWYALEVIRMVRRLVGVLILAAGAVLIAGVIWPLPYHGLLTAVSAVICIISGLYELFRPQERNGEVREP